MFDLGKFVPKLPAFAFHYWDCFLGICFVLAALIQGTALMNPLLLFGFCFITFSMSRRCWNYIGAVRLGQYSPQYKRTLAYPKVLAGMFWLIVSWVCFRYAALNANVAAGCVRWIFHY